jgi:hypothetical protein
MASNTSPLQGFWILFNWRVMSKYTEEEMQEMRDQVVELIRSASVPYDWDNAFKVYLDSLDE